MGPKQSMMSRLPLPATTEDSGLMMFGGYGLAFGI